MAAQTASPEQMTATWLQGTNRIEVVQGSMGYGQKNPITIKSADYVAQVIQKTQLIYTFANSNTTAQTVAIVDPDWPYSSVGESSFTSNTTKKIWSLTGAQAYWQQKFQEPAWVDTVSNVTASASTIPASGSATLTATVYTKMNLAVSQAELTGLYLAAARGEIATVDQNWVSENNLASAFSLPAGVTLSSVTGTVTLGQLQYASVAENGKSVVPLTYVATQHRTKSMINLPLVGASEAKQTLKIPGTLLRLSLILYTANGYRDVGNSLGLTSIQMQYGSVSYPINIAEDFSRVFSDEQHRFRRYQQNEIQDKGLGGTFLTAASTKPLAPQGVYTLDNTSNAANLVNLSNYPENSVDLNLIFSDAPPTNSIAAVWAETLLPLTVKA